MLTYPGVRKFMEQIFDSSAGFRAMAPNVPIKAQNTKVLTTHTVFELVSSSLSIMVTYPGKKIYGTDF